MKCLVKLGYFYKFLLVESCKFCLPTCNSRVVQNYKKYLVQISLHSTEIGHLSVISRVFHIKPDLTYAYLVLVVFVWVLCLDAFWLVIIKVWIFIPWIHQGIGQQQFSHWIHQLGIAFANWSWTICQKTWTAFLVLQKLRTQVGRGICGRFSSNSPLGRAVW